MSIFDNLKKGFGDWIQVVDEKNSLTIENFDYKTGVQGLITTKHCAKCVSVNQCWFKDENHKKPEPYPITGVEFFDALVNGITPGLYHFMCHCEENPIVSPSVSDIKLIIETGKIDWLFKSKGEWLKAMGYESNYEVINLFYEKIIEAYILGNYTIQEHTKYGAKINLFLDMPGTKGKTGKIYKIKSNFMVFPNGKLKCNTLLGGWQ